MIVVMHLPYGGVVEKAVGFTDEQKAMAYIRKHLKSWNIYDERYQFSVQCIQTVEHAQILIEECSINNLQVVVVDELNPDVS